VRWVVGSAPSIGSLLGDLAKRLIIFFLQLTKASPGANIPEAQDCVLTTRHWRKGKIILRPLTDVSRFFGSSGGGFWLTGETLGAGWVGDFGLSVQTERAQDRYDKEERFHDF